jgi:beta-ureidopropionase / N-carbamoyl-L-amino-acid hydrolase
MPRIQGTRLMADLRRLAEFGRYKTGVHRPTYSSDDMSARHWLRGRMAEAGLEPTIDGIGNVIGRSTASDDVSLLVPTWSHSHTQGGSTARWA